MKIILLCTCDVECSDNSLKPFWVGSNVNKFFKAVRKGIEDGVFSYGERHRPEHLMLEEFDHDHKVCNVFLWDCIFNEGKLSYSRTFLIDNNNYLRL